MKKRLSVFVIAAILLTMLFPLAACEPRESTPEPPPVSYGTATVNYHYQYDVVIEEYYQEKYTVQIGKSYDLTEFYTPPMRAGYKFLGWTQNEGGTGDVISAPFSITGSGASGTVYDLYAKYEEITFEVVYHLDGGTNHPDNPTSLTGKQTLKDPTKEKHNFLGWYRSPDFTDSTKVASMTDDKTTTVDLYAKWQRVYEIKYVSDQPKIIVRGDRSNYHYTRFTEDQGEMTILLQPEYFPNYMFRGWECEEGAELVPAATITIDPKETKKDLTFTARYYEASNPRNTEGLGTMISYGTYIFYARPQVKRIVVPDVYTSMKIEKTSQVTVYYCDEKPEVVYGAGVTVTFIQDSAEVEKWFAQFGG